jgi:hypothetical protein
VRKKEEEEKGRCFMKKLILILVIAAIAAPLYAAGRVQFYATDNEDGTCTITFDANDVIGIEPVAMGLDVKVNGSDPCHAITAVSGMDSFFEIFMDYAYDDPCSYTYGAGNPVADPCAAGSASLPSHHFCISMGGLGGETDPDEKAAPDNGVAFVLTAGNLPNYDPCDPGTQASGHIKINALRGGVIGKDTDPMETNLVPVHLPFTITNIEPTECVKSDAPFYNEWLGSNYAGTPTAKWASPDCWCYERNCRGDADGIKTGVAWVNTPDLTIFVSAFGKADFKMDQTLICADFDHIKTGVARVNTPDLTEFVSYFGKADFKCPVCPKDWDGDLDDDYNFWCTPGACP